MADALRKAALKRQIEEARRGISRSVDGLRHDLDVKAHLKESVVEKKGLWLGGAALVGWLLAGWPRRRRKALPPPAPASHRDEDARREPPVAVQMQRGGLLMAVLGLVGSILRPALTRFVTRKLTELASGAAETSWRDRRDL